MSAGDGNPPGRVHPAASVGGTPDDGDGWFVRVVLAGLAVMAIVAAGVWRWRTPPEFASLPRRPLLAGFTLTNAAGDVVTAGALRGHWTVAGLVCGSCSSLGLEVTTRMIEVQEATRGREDVRFFAITLDPRSDTPRSLARFAARVRLDTNRWVLATGEARVVREVTQGLFATGEADVRPGGDPASSVHPDQLLLLDPTGMVVGSYDANRSSLVVSLLETLKAGSVHPGGSP